MQLSAPPAMLDGPIPAEIRAAILAAPGEHRAWVEKCRRFIGAYVRDLRHTARRRFGSAADEHLCWFAELMLAVAETSPDQDAAPCDPAVLSAAFAALEAQDAPMPAQRSAALALRERLRHWLLADRHPLPCDGLGGAFAFDSARWGLEAKDPPRVLILSPNPYSLYTLSVLQLCLQHRVPVAGVLLRSFTFSRFMAERRRDGLAPLIGKIWRKLVLRADENADSGPLSLREVLATLGVQHSDARALARANQVPVFSCAEFDETAALDWVKGLRPEIGLFTGGGLIKPSLQSLFSLGIVNTHMGHLPRFKGMDVVEWPILEGKLQSIGATTHIMDAGLDTGPVLQRLDVGPPAFSTLGQLRNTIGALMPLVCFDSALGLKSGRLVPLRQPAAGRQYYFVHAAIHPLVDEVLGAKAQPSPSAASAAILAVKSELGRLSKMLPRVAL
jgi:methionyl-tRNA formyltransferase